MGVSLESILTYGNSQWRYVQSRTLESIGHDVLAAQKKEVLSLKGMNHLLVRCNACKRRGKCRQVQTFKRSLEATFKNVHKKLVNLKLYQVITTFGSRWGPGIDEFQVGCQSWFRWIPWDDIYIDGSSWCHSVRCIMIVGQSSGQENCAATSSRLPVKLYHIVAWVIPARPRWFHCQLFECRRRRVHLKSRSNLKRLAYLFGMQMWGCGFGWWR